MTALEAMRSTVLLAEANRELLGTDSGRADLGNGSGEAAQCVGGGRPSGAFGNQARASRLTSVIDQMLAERSHRRFYEPLLGDLRRSQIVAQPCDRGTAPAILYGIRRAGVSGPTLQ